MPTELAELFDDYWRAITRAEDFICQYGHDADPSWDCRSNRDLLTAHEALCPILKYVSPRPMIRNLPGGINAFAAENFHYALVMVLNPPERWFGQIGMLDSSEYLALKKDVEEEQSRLVSLVTQLERLSDDVRKVFEAVTSEPLVGDQIARKVDVHPDNVRRHLSLLKKAGLIQHVPRVGYFRP